MKKWLKQFARGLTDKAFVLERLRNTGAREAATVEAEAPELDGTAIIEREAYIPDFNPAKQYLNWRVGAVVRDGGQVWQLIQPYDSSIYTDSPENMRAQWGLCHTKNPEKAKPYVAPLGQSGVYMKNECCVENEVVYRSLIDNNVWKPSEYPTGWEKVK